MRGELDAVRDELNARDVIIARLEAEPNNLIPGLKENNDAIANLELKLIGVITELKDQENLITELGDELLTVGTPGLVKYINSIDPESGIIVKTINNAITRHLKGGEGEEGKSKNLSSLEATYNFKYLGKVANSHKFSIPKL